MNAARDGKARTRRRFLLAGAVSLALHATFFGLLFSASPAPGRGAFLMVALTDKPSAEDDALGPSPGPERAAAAPPAAAPAAAAAASRGAPQRRAVDHAAEALAGEPGPSGEAGSAAAAPSAASAGLAAEPRADTDPGAAGGWRGGEPGTALGSPGFSGTDAEADAAEAALYDRIRAAVEARKDYPAAARLRGTQGEVRVRFRVSPDGRLLGAELAASSGSSLLDSSALALVASVFPVPNPAGRELGGVLTVSYTLTP